MSTSHHLRPRPRSKRSTTNLADLRLAPLSIDYGAPQAHRSQSPHHADDANHTAFMRQHPSYLQRKSAPPTPALLSRSSSSHRLGGGLSRKNSLYDEGEDGDVEAEEPAYAHGGSRVSWRQKARLEAGTRKMPKSKSEAALSTSKLQDRLSNPRVPLSPTQDRQYWHSKHRIGTTTPSIRISEESWLTHTGAMTSALVREDKGQSWIASAQSSTSLAPSTSSDDEDDDHYEEMAALSASTAKLQLGEYDGGSPISVRYTASQWGSRYGSRPSSKRGSRLNSRVTSPVGTRTPRGRDWAQRQAGYFDYPYASQEQEQDFTKLGEKGTEETDDEETIARLHGQDGLGFGGVVDRLVNFQLFRVSETTDEEGGGGGGGGSGGGARKENETDEEAKQRREEEVARRKGEKARLTTQPPPAPLGERVDGTSGEVGGWQDAAWLLSVASKAIF